MDKLLVKGGAPLHGEVAVSGAKNATLPLMAATLLAEGESLLENVPDLADVRTMARLLERLGVQVARGAGKASHAFSLTVSGALQFEAPYDLVKTMRASVLVLGPLVARFGRARVALPGGCAIGARPIDQHLKGLEALGAKIVLEHGYVEATAKKLKGASIVFDMPTVTGTENVLMAAVLAEGITQLENCACEPEVVELAAALNGMGARIAGAGTKSITVIGVNALGPMQHEVEPDRIEAGTLLIAGAITGGDVTLTRCAPAHLESLIVKLRAAGVRIDATAGDRLRVRATTKLSPVDLETQPYPGFPTDMQAQFMALMTVARGTSIIKESVFENRFMHVLELTRMGAFIQIDGHQAVVQGVKRLSGAPVMASDLRASAALVLAGLRAEGTTEIQRVYHLDRGYERLEKKLRKLGANIRRVST